MKDDELRKVCLDHAVVVFQRSRAGFGYEEISLLDLANSFFTYIKTGAVTAPEIRINA